MTKFALAVIVALLPATPAQALNSKSFVSSTGSGATCTRAAPCTDFGTAALVTQSGGEIDCLDSGPFDGGLFTKSVTIDCASTEAMTVGFAINGPGIVVRIRNLTMNGLGGSGSSASGGGIDFQDGAALFVENCVIQNLSTNGIKFRPSSPGSQLVVTDTALSNNGSGSTGGGILVSPQSGGSARVELERVSVGKNVFGIAVDGTGSSGGINMTIADSVLSGNINDGLVATTPSGGAPIGVMVTNTKSTNNGFGIRSIGPNVTVRVENSKVIGNGTGLTALSGGALLTFGNNAVRANGTDGAFSGTVGLQ
jgi:hypothetical protein